MKGTISAEMVDTVLDQVGARKIRMKLVGGEGAKAAEMTLITPAGFAEVCDAAGIALKDGQKYTITIADAKA